MQKENIIINSVKELYHKTNVLGLWVKTIDGYNIEFSYKTINGKIKILVDDKKLTEEEIKDKIVEVINS